MAGGLPSIEGLRAGRKDAVARALAAIETHTDDADLQQLLDWAWSEPKGHVLGITGPPGVGKSSLINALIADWRRAGHSVGVIAVDPSSRRTGGALLGDRTRITTNPDDPHVFVRSMAARERLGGLADITFPAAVLMRAVFDRIIVETVGVGQSETDIADLADTVMFCVQPASGDALQFMKAGIMEVPHIAVITKADMGAVADRARADVIGAIGLASDDMGGWDVPVLTVSVQMHQGLADLEAAVERHREWTQAAGRRATRRCAQAEIYLADVIRDRYGRLGLERLRASRDVSMTVGAGQSPFALLRASFEVLNRQWRA